MKIGIITIVRVNNYGAELQAYALQKKLQQLGHDAEIIDYLFYKHPSFRKTKQSKPWIRLDTTRRLREFFYPIVYKVKSIPFRKRQKQRNQKFRKFHEENTKFSSQFNSYDALYNAKFDYDVYMVGSDQVWNPHSNTSLDPYFLTFAPEGKKRISYASSFGVSKIPQEHTSFYKERLQKMNSISVREVQGVPLVKELVNKKAHHVLDPTLLLNKQEWKNIAIPPQEDKPYLLLYILSKSDYATSLAKKIKSITGYNVIRLCKEATIEDRDSEIKNIIDASPSEYLGYFMNASFIITTSFHGTAFSVNFNIPFFTILPAHKTNNSRQESLLGLTNLKHRLLKEHQNIEQLEDKITLDFLEANKLLENERKKSEAYLNESITKD
jgi:polysaccharide pyruvyl transferase WcaK-like protein